MSAAPAAKPATAAPPPAAEPKAAGGGKGLLVIVGLNTVLVMAGLGYMVWKSGHPPPAAAPQAKGEAGAGEDGEEKGEKGEGKDGEPGEEGGGEKAAAPKKAMYTLPTGEFLVRLPSAEGDRYARFTFEVQLRRQSDGDVFKTQLPDIRDRFIGVLTALSADSVRGKAELDQLKTKLLRELRESMPAGSVKALYVTEFVVQ